MTTDPSEIFVPIGAQAAHGALCADGRCNKQVQGRVRPTETNLQLDLVL